MTRPRALFLCLLSLVLAAASLATLAKLPYSTSRLLRVTEAQALEAPGDRMKLGPLVWEFSLYASDPALDSFRQVYGPVCSGKRGLEAVTCVSRLLASRSPVGDPAVEFVDADYVPSVALTSHCQGAKGHCTSRSALGAAALLSLGVPARVVQVLPPDGRRGHNIIGVWDEKAGWVLFDPVSETAFQHNGAYLSSVGLANTAGPVEWDRAPRESGDPNNYVGSTIHYPEPWLYTRIGERCAPWPFRACFAQTGPKQFLLGPAQKAALGSFLLFLALGVLGLGLLLWPRPAARPEEPVPEPEPG
ncbi:MAG: hypothetical protein AMXMBFR34_28420 [Myxococcaceae bacterium]